MGYSKIEWTDATWNPVTGCSKVSEGCRHCYAEPLALRLRAMGQPNYQDGFAVRIHPHVLGAPLAWKTPIVVKLCSGDTGPLRDAGRDRDLLVGEPVGFIKEILPVLARHPTGLPVTFATFIRVVYTLLGGTAEGAPDLTLFQPEARPVPVQARQLDDLLVWISCWLQADPRNLGRFLSVAKFYPELVAIGRRLRIKPNFKNAASLAQRLHQQEEDLVEVLGFEEQFPGGHRRLIGFTKTGEGRLPPIPPILFRQKGVRNRKVEPPQ